MAFLLLPFVIMTLFSSQGWQSWDVEHRPVIPEGMPVLIDDDLLFEDRPAVAWPTTVINRWLRDELLAAISAHPEHHQQAQLFLVEARKA